MPTIRVPPGIVRGETKAMVPGRWFLANLIRWSAGVMRPVGGWERLNANPLASIPRGGHVYLDSSSVRHMGIICDGRVFVETDNVYLNITPSAFIDANSTTARGYGSGDYGILNYGKDNEDRGSGLGAADPNRALSFSMDNWNDELLFCSSADGRLMVWNPATPGVVAVAANAPSIIQAFIVTDEHHVMTFGSAGTPNRVAWSDQDNRTGWDYANVTGQAGFFDLEGAGTIIGSCKLPGAILIFTSTSVWLCRYIGQPYYYSFVKIAEGSQPISAQAIAVAGAKAFWMGRNAFWMYEGGVVTSLQATLGDTPFLDLDPEAAPRKVTAGFNGVFPEVWFFYPEQQDMTPALTENTKYVVYNYEENWWADGDLSRSMYFSSSIDKKPIAGDDHSFVYQHEVGFLKEGAPRTGMVYAEVGSLSFDDGENNWTVNQAQVDSATGAESVAFTFTGQRVRGGPVVTLQDNVIPRANGFLDLHFTARDFSVRITGLVDAAWTMGAFIFHKIVKRGPI